MNEKKKTDKYEKWMNNLVKWWEWKKAVIMREWNKEDRKKKKN